MSTSISCRQCKTTFSVTEEDFAFIQKVSPVIANKRLDIPPPTLCPDCRLQRRLAHRNERSLYKRRCSKTGNNIVAIHPSDSPFVVYENPVWWGDSWDGREYGRDIDLGKPFLDQFVELRAVVPRMAVLQSQNENSIYTNCVSNLKDCYLLTSSDFDRDCYYGTWVERSMDCTDNYVIQHCERTYQSIFSDQLYNCQFAILCVQCRDSAFLFDCRTCSDCILCWNLRGKQYCIENEQFTKEEYGRRKAAMNLGQWSAQHHMQERLKECTRTKAMHPAMWHRGRIIDSTGDWLCDVEKCTDCYELVSAKDCVRVRSGYEVKDAMDCNYANKELGYENCECFPLPYQSAFNVNSYTGANLYYCDMCMNECKDCFGCVGLKHQQYCILNKQYTKEEYEELAPKVIAHMRDSEEWGEYFPIAISTFAYNETNAQEIFPMTKADTEKRGWAWRDAHDDIGAVTKTIRAQQLPEEIDSVPDDILEWAITCVVTGRPFKIIKQELEFYRNARLPIPREHPDERHKKRIEHRNPMVLYKRPCAKCRKAMETTYAPERKEKVLCERCYLEAVY